MREAAGPLAPLLEALVAADIGRGRLRKGLDPRLTELSMVSLVVFPFLAIAVTNRVFGVLRDDVWVERLIRHTVDLLLEGISSGPSGGRRSP